MGYEINKINEIAGSANGMGPLSSADIQKFLDEATAREISYFFTRIRVGDNSQWFHRANVALQIRLSEDAAISANKLILHSEKLTKQTDILIGESKGLSKLTGDLKWLTVALGIFAIVQIVLMVFDIWKHK